MNNRKIVILIASTIIIVSGTLFFVLNKDSSCFGNDKLSSNGECIIDGTNGCKYDQKLGPKSAVCN